MKSNRVLVEAYMSDINGMVEWFHNHDMPLVEIREDTYLGRKQLYEEAVDMDEIMIMTVEGDGPCDICYIMRSDDITLAKIAFAGSIKFDGHGSYESSGAHQRFIGE